MWKIIGLTETEHTINQAKNALREGFNRKKPIYLGFFLLYPL